MNKSKFKQFYKAQVIEIIKHLDEPTTHLRVRVPSIHRGLRKQDLPVAKPMGIPGNTIDLKQFIKQLKELKYVYVYFESGDISQPMYIVPLDKVTTESNTKKNYWLADGSLRKLTIERKVVDLVNPGGRIEIVAGIIEISRGTTTYYATKGAVLEHFLIRQEEGLKIDGDLVFEPSQAHVNISNYLSSDTYIRVWED